MGDHSEYVYWLLEIEEDEQRIGILYGGKQPPRASSATQIQAIHLSRQVILEEVVEHLGGLPPIYNSSQRYGEWQACTAARIPNLIESY